MPDCVDAQAGLCRSNGGAHVLKGTFAHVAFYKLACEILNMSIFLSFRQVFSNPYHVTIQWLKTYSNAT